MLSVCFRWIERLKIVSGTNVDLHARRNKLRNKNFFDVYLASLGRKFIYGRLRLLFGLIQLVGSTRPKFDI